MCICVCLYVEPGSRSKDYVPSGIKIGSILCSFTPVSSSVPETEGICRWVHLFCFVFVFEDVPLVKFMYPVFTSNPGGVTVSDPGLCCCPLSTERCKLPLFVYSMSTIAL